MEELSPEVIARDMDFHIFLFKFQWALYESHNRRKGLQLHLSLQWLLVTLTWYIVPVSH